MKTTQTAVHQDTWQQRGTTLLNVLKITLGASLLVSAYIGEPEYNDTEAPAWMTVSNVIEVSVQPDS